MEPVAQIDADVSPDLRLGGLSLWVKGRQFPGSDDYWDGNWLFIRGRMKASGAVVECEGPLLHLTELAAFSEELAMLQDRLVGKAELTCMEPNLNVRLEGNWLGHVAVEVSITSDHLSQSHRFMFEIDQTYLGPACASCADIIKRFPIVGSPSQ